ncbi:MAG: peptidoglycan -binding protein [Alphaproteobacteria bacterium]|nr:peptidoglycan -binding protein [Alphaproteobacteria bacterium]
MRKRNKQSNIFNFWPSFVDALSNLLIVVLFFLLLFVLAHFFIGKNLNSKNSQIEVLNSELFNLTKELNLVKKANKSLQEEYNASLLKITSLNENISSLTKIKDDLEKDLKNKNIDLENEQKISNELKLQIALLTTQTEEMNKQLDKLSNILSESEKKSAEQKAQIVDLGKKLNKALAQKASELTSYRSEFFGVLRKILKDYSDIKIEGDRFVFQSELFFKSGSADLEPNGKKALNLLASSLKDLETKIPSKINWILRIDGHTDNIPIHNELFASNWHLSTMRSIAVVNYLTSQGVKQKRLVPAGFGSNYPVARGNSPNSRKKNRRIEFKLTEK